ncbi:hypothetical protein AcW1_002036 [Taiwanofungus camphoratus]|nr:hypothetical protein AcW1_002036 [Antrodia cinnamomea]
MIASMTFLRRLFKPGNNVAVDGPTNVRVPVACEHSCLPPDQTPSPALIGMYEDSRSHEVSAWDAVNPITIARPPAAYRSLLQYQEDLIIEFFGGRPAPRDDPPPSYQQTTNEEQLPAYPGDSGAEPVTLAKYLFSYGFIFFPFWLAGAVILWSPLNPTEDWEIGKPAEERTRLLRLHRTTELKWARRCLWAMLIMLATIMAVVLVLVVMYRRGRMA